MTKTLVALLLIAGTGVAQPKKQPPADPPPAKKPPIINMPGMGIDGRIRGASLLYFLDRASEELERASLEKRSFIPDMVRTLDEEAL